MRVYRVSIVDGEAEIEGLSTGPAVLIPDDTLAAILAARALSGNGTAFVDLDAVLALVEVGQ